MNHLNQFRFELVPNELFGVRLGMGIAGFGQGKEHASDKLRAVLGRASGMGSARAKARTGLARG